MDVKTFTARFAAIALVAALGDAALTLFLLQADKDPLLARAIALLTISVLGAPLFRSTAFKGASVPESGILFVAAALLDFAVYWKLLRVIGPGETQALLALAAGTTANSLFKYMLFRPLVVKMPAAGKEKAGVKRKRSLRQEN